MFRISRQSPGQVFADKVGTAALESGDLCVWGNYAPAWTDHRQTYNVKGVWVDSLWRPRKLAHAKYEQYVVLARDGVLGRKRNLAAVKEGEEAAADDAEMAETIKRIRGNPSVYRPMKKYPPLEDWPRVEVPPPRISLLRAGPGPASSVAEGRPGPPPRAAEPQPQGRVDSWGRRAALGRGGRGGALATDPPGRGGHAGGEGRKNTRGAHFIRRGLFRAPEDRLRWPMVIVSGPSHSGKTELAKSLFENPLELKIGDLEHFPDQMRNFSRRVHDGVVLDDVRDLAFIGRHQHIFQGKWNSKVEFGSTPGGTCSYDKYLYKVPFAVTINGSTKNLSYLQEHDWLGKPENRVLFEVTEPPWETGEETAAPTLPLASQ